MLHLIQNRAHHIMKPSVWDTCNYHELCTMDRHVSLFITNSSDWGRGTSKYFGSVWIHTQWHPTTLISQQLQPNMNAHKQHRCHSVPAKKETVFANEMFSVWHSRWHPHACLFQRCNLCEFAQETHKSADMWWSGWCLPHIAQAGFAGETCCIVVCVESNSIVIYHVYIIFPYMIVQYYFALWCFKRLHELLCPGPPKSIQTFQPPLVYFETVLKLSRMEGAERAVTQRVLVINKHFPPSFMEMSVTVSEATLEERIGRYLGWL